MFVLIFPHDFDIFYILSLHANIEFLHVGFKNFILILHVGLKSMRN